MKFIRRRMAMVWGLMIFITMCAIGFFFTLLPRGPARGNIQSLTSGFEAVFLEISTSKRWSAGTFDANGNQVGPLRQSIVSKIIRSRLGRPAEPVLALTALPHFTRQSGPSPGYTGITVGFRGKGAAQLDGLLLTDATGRAVPVPGRSWVGHRDRMVLLLHTDAIITNGVYELVLPADGTKLFRFEVKE